MIGRREFITLIGGATATWPLAARAQPSAMPVIGYLTPYSPDTVAAATRLDAFRQGLNETGFVEGRNVVIEYRWAEGQYDRLPAMAADLVRRRVAVIVAAGGNPPALAAKAVTTTIPIVFQTGDDPVTSGLVVSLSRPGGNLTGAAVLVVQLGPKRMQILHELVPNATVIAVLINPTNRFAAEVLMREAQAAARTLGVQAQIVRASTDHEIELAFANLVPMQAGGLVSGADMFFNDRSEELAALAARHGIPTIFPTREYVEAGGLVSYGPRLDEGIRLLGTYAGRILKGEKPADLPVQQVTKVELVINLKTAKALGVTVPLTLRGRADEVIE
jgi:putative ABC transport system substrate-binding protein